VIWKRIRLNFNFIPKMEFPYETYFRILSNSHFILLCEFHQENRVRFYWGFHFKHKI
jgi:hypothetical protein